MWIKLLILSCFVVLVACSGLEEMEYRKNREHNETGEFVYRYHDEYHFAIPSPVLKKRIPYAWEENLIGEHPRITKEFFRCNGSTSNPAHVEYNNAGEEVRYFDCEGPLKHSLPIRDDKEFIFPILIDILNYIQEKTEKRVVITCGHRCPQHNIYVDSSRYNRTSKHMIGAEVDLYVQGMWKNPMDVVNLIFEFYKENPKYKEQKQYEEFFRYEKDDTNVSTPPWYNKEIFVKLFKKEEGRDIDNRHSYPYVSIQVRYDRDTDKRVSYTWEQAFYNYLRW